MTIENIKEYLPQNASARICGNTAFFPVAVSDIQKLTGDLHQNKHLPLHLITTTDERAAQG